MSAPEFVASAMAQEAIFAGDEVDDFASGKVRDPAVRDSYTPAPPARYPSPFIQDYGSFRSVLVGLSEEESSDNEDCLFEIDADKFYRANPAVSRSTGFGNTVSTSLPNGDENAKPSAAEACYQALPKAENVDDKPGSSVRIATRSPGSGRKVPANVEVITIESDDGEDDEEECFDGRDDYSELSNHEDYNQSVENEHESEDGSDLIDYEHRDGYDEPATDQYSYDQYFDEQQLEDEHVQDEEDEGNHVDLVEEKVEDDQIDLVDDSSDPADDDNALENPATSSPAAKSNRAITQSMLAMPDSPLKKATDNQTASALFSPSKIAQDFYYIPDSPKKNKRQYLSEPTDDTRNWELVIDPATGGVANYTSTEAERDEIIRLYVNHHGDIHLIRASLPGSNQTTRTDNMEVRRIILILQKSHDEGLIDLLPHHQRDSQNSRETLRRKRSRPTSTTNGVGHGTEHGEGVSTTGYEGDGSAHAAFTDAPSIDGFIDHFDARFAQNLAREDDAPASKRRRCDEDIRRRAKRDSSCEVEASLGSTMRALEEVPAYIPAFVELE